MSDVREQIVILDYGSQYTQVIARRVREFVEPAVLGHWPARAHFGGRWNDWI